MTLKYPKVLVDGKWIDSRYSQHPNYTKDRDTVSMRKVKVYPPSPDGIGGYNWQRITEWIPNQIEQGNLITRQSLSEFLGVSQRTLAARAWILTIYKNLLDDNGKPLFELIDDPSYPLKRGRRVQCLKPVNR